MRVNGKWPIYSVRLFSEREESWCYISNLDHSETPSSNFFCQIKDFRREQFESRFLSLELSIDKKWKKSIFQLLPRNQDFIALFQFSGRRS